MFVDLHRKFVKKFKKLQPKLKERFLDRKNLFLINPSHPLLDNHALQGDRLGQWSINVTGNWRALYEFQNAETIIFVDIDTHPNLYG
ncbi:MAG: type II toxin-antitoxin system mRNA interferase toxin, RelE/StbE family [Patescibacteria group bacterium]